MTVRLSDVSRPSKPSVFTTEGRELYHLETVVAAMDICLPFIHETPLARKKARRLLARAWNRDVRSVWLIRQKWGLAAIQTEHEINPATRRIDYEKRRNNVFREQLFNTAIGFANQHNGELSDWAKGRNEATLGLQVFAKLTQENLLRSVPAKVLAQLLRNIGAFTV